MSDNVNTILIVEDDKELLMLYKKKLLRGGYKVLSANCIAAAKKELENSAVDLIVLDVMLPDGSGFDFCKEIKKRKNTIVLFLTGKTQVADKITGLDGGGDYYLVKPCDLDELLAVVSSLLRRLKKDNIIELGKLKIYTEKMIATANSKDLLLTPKEFTVLYVLANNHNSYITAEELSEKCWSNSQTGYSPNLLWAQLSRLRKKLEDEDIFYIDNVRNKGYILKVK